jgi:hypothetical protein
MRTSVLVAVLSLIPMSFAHAQIPTAERDALIALYNSADGDNWLDKTNWLGTVGTECTWFGVVCDGANVRQLSLISNQLNGSIPPELEDLSSLTDLDLNTNLLSGSIPPELGSLSSLTVLNLRANQLSGNIPPELGDLSSLTLLNLRANQLSGSIPVELGKLSSLTQLSLGSNQLSGSIPVELGSLSSLLRLYLHSNQLSGSIPEELADLSLLERLAVRSNRLSGSIPSELENLSTLQDGRSDFRYNALHSDNATLIAFLNSKQDGGDWQSTQTIAPENLAVDRLGDHTVWLTWDAVSYQSDRGGYSVCFAPTSSGAWTCDGWTEEKTDTTYPATGLDPATSYDLAVVTYTDPHVDNQNVVNSNFSPEVMATTASLACAQPIIEIVWGDPITLSVPGSYDSYLWITGETTSTIDIAPLFDQWYWVTVTSTGPCEETGTVWVDPALNPIFADGFELGDTTEWSASVP